MIFRSTPWQDHTHPNGAVSEPHGVGDKDSVPALLYPQIQFVIFYIWLPIVLLLKREIRDKMKESFGVS